MSEQQQQFIDELFKILRSVELAIRKEEMMSKSGRNIIPIAHLPKNYSVDVSRLYFNYSN